LRFYDDAIVAFLLIAGLFLPTSLAGESQEYLVGVAFAVLFIAACILIWNHGSRPGAVLYISLPILFILSACTLISCQFRFGGTIFAEYFVLTVIFALNLKRVRAGPLVSNAFFVANAVLIACGVAVLIGSLQISGFLTAWYSQFYPELVPGMLDLHKPVLTFGTHSLAGFFTYLFFWLNWERYKVRRSVSNLVFALCEVTLLLAITSFTSFALAVLALAQIGFWLWKNNRKVLLVSVGCVILMILLTADMLAQQIEILWQNPQVAASVLNADNSGLLVRYEAGGTVRGIIDYISDHPYAPLGFTYAAILFHGDSGPVEYLLRGSLPLLLLVYVGFYKFLRYNSSNSRYAVTLFLIFLAFETGFGALPYFRTLFLLPFFVVYLNDINPVQDEGYAFAS
jgi:hypothetical protein